MIELKTNALVSKDSSKTIWRWYRNYLQMLICSEPVGGDIYNILSRRIKWINENRL